MNMSVMADEVLELPEKQRAQVAAKILHSLSEPADADDPEGWAIAAERDAELDAHPEIGLSFEQFDQAIRARRRCG